MLFNLIEQPEIKIVAPKVKPRLEEPRNDSVTPPIFTKSGKKVLRMDE